MNKELRERLRPVAEAFYLWLSQITVENWRRPIPDAVDTFMHYGGVPGEELADIYEEEGHDSRTVNEIDRYLNRIVEAVNNDTVVEHRGGARENSGRKKKESGKKAVTVSFCCSPAQRAQLDAATKSSGLSRSDYITMRLFGDENSGSAGN